MKAKQAMLTLSKFGQPRQAVPKISAAVPGMDAKISTISRVIQVGMADAFKVRMMLKTSLHLATFALFFAALMAKLREVARAQVPVGYEDDSGFHYGEPPSSDDDNWPSAT